MIIKKLSPAIGAEISGLDLSGPLTDTQLNNVYSALVDNKVIIFHDQDLGAESHLKFAESFGDIDRPHSVYPHVDGFQQVTLLENDGDRPPDTNAWHTDLTYYPNPPFASILHSRVIPETGGDTLWTSMYAAYDALSEHVKAEIEGLQAIHDPGTFRNQFLGKDLDIDKLNDSMKNVGSAVHPVVKTHPATGSRFLFVNRSFTNQIYGFSTTKSDRLLNYLFDQINQPEFQIRHRWSVGDVVMWDNRVTQHYAVADYAPNYRRMHRVTILNDRRADGG
jgi:taurine dioxygenase